MPGISLRLPRIEPICGQVHPTVKRDGPARYWPALILRVSCFLAIALGILSLLSVWTGQTGGAIGILWVSPEEALGLIFVGFAVRMSRLEAHSRSVRAVVQTSRICLIVVGASLTVGGHAVGICYLAIGLSLVSKQRLPHIRVDAVLTALVCTFLSSCWSRPALWAWWRRIASRTGMRNASGNMTRAASASGPRWARTFSTPGARVAVERI